MPLTDIEPEQVTKASRQKPVLTRKPVVDSFGTTFTFKSCISEDHGKKLYGVAFNPCLPGQHIFATAGGTRVSVYKCAADGGCDVMLVFNHANKEEDFYCCCWVFLGTQVGHCVLAAGNSGIICVISTKEAKIIKSLIGHGRAVNELIVHPTQAHLVLSASADHTARLWNVATGQCVAVFGAIDGHRDEVVSADFDATGDHIVTGSMDHSIKLWKITGNPVLLDAMQTATTCEIGANPKMPLAVHMADFTARDVHTNYVDCVRFWHGCFLSKGIGENCICLWKAGDDDVYDNNPIPVVNTRDVDLLCEFNVDLGQYWFIRFAVDREYKRLACGTEDGCVLLWNLQLSDLRSHVPPCVLPMKLKRAQKCQGLVRQVAFSPDGTQLIAVSDDASILRWTIQSPPQGENVAPENSTALPRLAKNT